MYAIILIQLSPTEVPSYDAAIDAIKNPVVACQLMFENIVLLTKHISDLEVDKKEGTYYQCINEYRSVCVKLYVNFYVRQMVK